MSSTPPPLPRLTLRVAVAGARALEGEAAQYVSDRWSRLLEALATELTHIGSRSSADSVTRYYAPETPLLRVVTGLSEGADTVIGQRTHEMHGRRQLNGVELELAAVIPASVGSYRDSRPASHHSVFDRLAAACSYVIALDGMLDKPSPDTALARRRRGRAYRAQAAVLLRQADLLVAATDAAQPGRVGGTLETVRAALERDMPVLFIDTARRRSWLIEPFHDLAAILSNEPLPDTEVDAALRAHARTLLADDGAPTDGASSHGSHLLAEYFRAANVPPTNATGQRRPTRRERLWQWFERRFQGQRAALTTDTALPVVAAWRNRAKQLNYHYAGLYRGAYLLNYALAILAVTLAALSLVLLGQAHTGPVAAMELTAPEPTTVAPGSRLQLVLLGLALLKVSVVGTIAWNTHQAHHGDWNDKLVDYRYLAERLRAMFYLPLLGSFEPPSAAPPQYASRVVRQSAVDWLLEAILRALPPSALATPVEVPGSQGGAITVHVLSPDAREGLRRLRDGWIPQQAAYHAQLSRTMDALHRFLDGWGRRLNVAVIGFVVIDILLTIGELLHLFPARVAALVTANMPWLVFLAAVLPAAVAGLNAVRFQSECRRLADRSAVIQAILVGRNSATAGGRLLAAQQLTTQMEHAKAQLDLDPGSWVVEVLRQTEVVARDLAEEVGEWSVLYAKELPEP